MPIGSLEVLEARRSGRLAGWASPGQTASMMTDGVRWMEAVCQQLPVQGDLLGGLVRIVERTAEFRALIVSCSLGRGSADEFSDVDAAITHTLTEADRLEVAASDLAGELGDVVDVHVHGFEGFGDPTRRVAAVYSNGGQLDLLLIPVASRSHHLAGEEVVVVDKDGHVSAPFTPPAEALAQRTSAQAVEYTHSAWWFLGDVAKYLERRSWYEAVERLGVARDYLLRLVAIGARTRFPQYGLVSLVDFAPHAIPARLDVTYPSPRDPESILSAAVTIAELIDDALVDASRATGKPLASRLAEDVRARLARVAL